MSFHLRVNLVAPVVLLGALVTTIASALPTPEQVTTVGNRPTVSRDGNWIAFVMGDSIAKVCPDGTGMVVLAEGIDPNWNRPGELIVFSDFSNNLFTVDATTAETTHVWAAPSGDRAGHPVWSPVRDEIVFAAPALALLQYPYGPATNIACGVCRDVQNTTWSPDGETIAFDAGRNIFTVPRIGGSIQSIASGDARRGFPAWSPDGKFIAFLQKPDRFENYWNLWVVDARGESFGMVQLTEGPYGNGTPSWSPDGTTIYFDSDRGGGGIWKLTFDSTVTVKHATWGAIKSRYR